MRSLPFRDYDERKRTTWDDLKKELDLVKRDIENIKGMAVSAEARKPILAELERQLNEVKEQMHDYIDTL